MKTALSNGSVTRAALTNHLASSPFVEKPTTSKRRKVNLVGWTLVVLSFATVAFVGYTRTLEDDPRKVYSPSITTHNEDASPGEASEN